MYSSEKLQSPPLLYLVRVIMSEIGVMLSFVFISLGCHLAIITLIHWIKIDHVL